MRGLIPAAAIAGISLAACTGPTRNPGVRDLEPRPVVAADDPINRQAQSTVDAIILALTLDGTSVRLDRATLARVPRSATQSRTEVKGDRVTVVGFAGNTRVSEVVVPDAVLNTQEGVGLVTLPKRQIVVSLPVPRAIDTIEVTAPATRATGRLDVRAAYAPYCREYNRENRYCPTPVQR